MLKDLYNTLADETNELDEQELKEVSGGFVLPGQPGPCSDRSSDGED